VHSWTMTIDVASLDAYEQPSDELRAIWKAYSKSEQEELIASGDIDDLEVSEKAAAFLQAGRIPSDRLSQCFNDFVKDSSPRIEVDRDAVIYYHPLIPGTVSA